VSETTILQEAQEIIFGARNASYGHPRDNFQNITDLWNAYLKDIGREITLMDHAVMMILLKCARLKNGVYHRDSVVDIAGYAGTIERLQEPVEETKLGELTYEKTGKPRQWGLLAHVPDEVVVTDQSGDFWKVTTNFLGSRFTHLNFANEGIEGEWDEEPYDPEVEEYGPFTEYIG